MDSKTLILTTKDSGIYTAEINQFNNSIELKKLYNTKNCFKYKKNIALGKKLILIKSDFTKLVALDYNNNNQIKWTLQLEENNLIGNLVHLVNDCFCFNTNNKIFIIENQKIKNIQNFSNVKNLL